MQVREISIPAAAAAIVALLGILTAPAVMPGRLAPILSLEAAAVSGLSAQDATGALARFEEQLRTRMVVVELEGQRKQYTLEQLGVFLDDVRTLEALTAASRPGEWVMGGAIIPTVIFDEKQAQATLYRDLAPHLQLPRDATLRLGAAGALAMIKGAPGEQIDVLALEQDLLQHIAQQTYSAPISLHIISAAASVQDDEVEQARILAEQLLRDGFAITFEGAEYTIAPFTVRRLLSFAATVDPTGGDNEVLGVQFDPQELQQYLATTIAPDVNQPAVNARFAIETDPSVPATEHDEAILAKVGGIRVTQFALPQRGQELNEEETIAQINQALAASTAHAQLVVSVAEPEITDTAALESLGVTTLLAHGVSDFVGSPKNRVHNISVGAAKYHGLLIAPGEEFAFNQYLGPVDASGGFLPELVIKTNVTVPEYGGGLCQVSTTAFRAAVESGLEITERRNHSYAVSYYGVPGFDATIYPGHTDLRFLNNTPGHILIQTRIEGTKLIFDFWGTDDGRVVEVAGPYPYDRQGNGAVKATLTQTVQKDGQVLFEDTFYSNYKSPKLFPKVLSANGERPPNNVEPISTPTPTGTGTQNKDQAKQAPTASPQPAAAQ